MDPAKLAAVIAANLTKNYSGQEVSDTGRTTTWTMHAAIRGISDVAELAPNEHLFMIVGHIDLPFVSAGAAGRGLSFGTDVYFSQYIFQQSVDSKRISVDETLMHELGHTGRPRAPALCGRCDPGAVRDVLARSVPAAERASLAPGVQERRNEIRPDVVLRGKAGGQVLRRTNRNDLCELHRRIPEPAVRRAAPRPSRWRRSERSPRADRHLFRRSRICLRLYRRPRTGLSTGRERRWLES